MSYLVPLIAVVFVVVVGSYLASVPREEDQRFIIVILGIIMPLIIVVIAEEPSDVSSLTLFRLSVTRAAAIHGLPACVVVRLMMQPNVMIFKFADGEYLTGALDSLLDLRNCGVSKPPTLESTLLEPWTLWIKSIGEVGSIFSIGDAATFNDIIHATGLIDLPLGGRRFIWMDKVGFKMSKLDHFLLSDNVIHDILNLHVVALDRVWSDHNPILLHSKKYDFGSSKPILTKLKDLKSHLKLWYSHSKEVEFSRRNSLLAELRDLEKKDDGHASDDEKTIRINRLQELDDLEKMESMDLVQKAIVNWEGVWISEPKDIKEAFLNFYKDKFSCHDSSISFPPVIPTHRHNTSDLDFLDVMVSMDEIKMEAFVVNFFSTSTFPQGSNSSFIPFIPNVSNPFFIKAYRPISLISLHYKIVAKILAKRFSKVIDSIISPEQSAFISSRQILDGPLILSEIIDWYKKCKKKLILFKVDFEKAFDSVPEIVVKSLESLRVAFFWGGHEHTKKIAWVKSSNTLASLDKGGFGAGSLKAFNKALLLKWKWHLFQNPNALWVHVVKAIHGDEAGVNLRGCQTKLLERLVIFTRVLGDEPLYIRYNRLSHLANNKDCFIRQRIVNGSWDWDWSRPITMGGTKTEFDNLILDIASLESDESVGSSFETKQMHA
ncbi:RNA-directed DNA polymerase, eukaryota, reverse transcriptase zinc-binding domain protein [Tanacetum coccineum]